MPTLIPIGGGYTDTFPGFIAAALRSLFGDYLYILMLPVAQAAHADRLTIPDLLAQSHRIERRRRALEQACRQFVPETVECDVVVPPIWTREAALHPLALDYFTDDLAAVYIAGGDQITAMQILVDTPFEAALTEAYRRGVVIGGNSAGLAVLSRTMIGGFQPGFDEKTALQAGAVDLWNAPPRRGLAFGLESALLEQHFWEYGRLPRLLNALAQPNTPKVGVGVDGYSGAVIRDGRLESVFGRYGAVILDAETLGAAERARFADGILSIRAVVAHLLGEGRVDYDLGKRQFTQTDAPSTGQTRQPAHPAGAGDLWLCSSMSDAPQIEAQGVDLDDGGALPADLVGIASLHVRAEDASEIDVAALAPLRDFWLHGGTLILSGAAAAIAGAHYAAAPHSIDETEDEAEAEVEAALQGALIEGMLDFAPGLGLIDANIEVRTLDENRLARLFALEHAHPVGTLGLSDGAALELSADGLRVTSDSRSGVIRVSMASAARSYGDNGAIAALNALIDVFAPGERVE
jgi:cyanophycinase